MQVGHTRRTFLQVASASVLAAACSAESAEVTRWPAREPIRPLDLEDLSGRRWSLPGLRGRAVLLNFWASWCEPCRAEMPTLQQLVELYGDDKLTVLAINFKEPRTTAERFAKRSGLNLPVLLDPAGDIARKWNVKVFPTTIAIAADGTPKWRARGEVDWSTAESGRMVEALFPR